MIGCYILILQIRKNFEVNIGKLGAIKFYSGYYAYVGSALGRNMKVERRVGRHLKLAQTKTGKPRWHIDYLLLHRETLPVHIVQIRSQRRIECIVSKKLGESSDSVVQGFGSSDCKQKCKGHLYYFNSNKNWDALIY